MAENVACRLNNSIYSVLDRFYLRKKFMYGFRTGKFVVGFLIELLAGR